MAWTDIEVPPQLAGLPRDHRGFVVPAEAPWTDDGPRIEMFGRETAWALAFSRSCSVCGFALVPSMPVWRLFTQRDAAICRLEREATVEEGVPGHLSCMLYSAQVCPYWRTPQARLGKESLRQPGAPRGGVAALMGHRDFDLLIDVTVPPEIANFLYRDLTFDIRFRDPSELAERYADTLRDEPVDMTGLRGYWTNTAAEIQAKNRLIRAGFNRLRTKEANHWHDRAAFALPVVDLITPT